MPYDVRRPCRSKLRTVQTDEGLICGSEPLHRDKLGDNEGINGRAIAGVKAHQTDPLEEKEPFRLRGRNPLNW